MLNKLNIAGVKCSINLLWIGLRNILSKEILLLSEIGREKFLYLFLIALESFLLVSYAANCSRFAAVSKPSFPKFKKSDVY
jgi:hypothetical protein